MGFVTEFTMEAESPLHTRLLINKRMRQILNSEDEGEYARPPEVFTPAVAVATTAAESPPTELATDKETRSELTVDKMHQDEMTGRTNSSIRSDFVEACTACRNHQNHLQDRSFVP